MAIDQSGFQKRKGGARVESPALILPARMNWWTPETSSAAGAAEAVISADARQADWEVVIGGQQLPSCPLAS